MLQPLPVSCAAPKNNAAFPVGAKSPAGSLTGEEEKSEEGEENTTSKGVNSYVDFITGTRRFLHEDLRGPGLHGALELLTPASFPRPPADGSMWVLSSGGH